MVDRGLRAVLRIDIGDHDRAGSETSDKGPKHHMRHGHKLLIKGLYT